MAVSMIAPPNLPSPCRPLLPARSTIRAVVRWWLRTESPRLRPTGSTAPAAFKSNQKDNVLAIIGNVGTPTAVVAVPLANEEKTLLFAPFAGGPNLRNNPPDRYVINFRAGYAEETNTMIDALIDIVGA